MTDSRVSIFASPNESLQIPIDKYIRGYSLSFGSPNATVKLLNPTRLVSATSIGGDLTGYSLINIDQISSDTHERSGILVAVSGQ
jgi:hypothetical protein